MKKKNENDENFRCRRWLKLCGREDLLEKNFDPEKCYKNYRVCGNHFEKHMFKNPGGTRSRLLDTALPIRLDIKTFNEGKFLFSIHYSDNLIKE